MEIQIYATGILSLSVFSKKCFSFQAHSCFQFSITTQPNRRSDIELLTEQREINCVNMNSGRIFEFFMFWSTMLKNQNSRFSRREGPKIFFFPYLLRRQFCCVYMEECCWSRSKRSYFLGTMASFFLFFSVPI